MNEVTEAASAAGEAVAAPTEKKKHVKQRLGIVTSTKVAKTVTVTVDRRVKHPRYGKFITRLKKYAVHDELGCAEGDRVLIEETRPLSKTKRWKIVEKLGKER
ncbi:MAG: 30S ribosomal protein S17 [Myxococcales bacterium]|nr:30S ribosomal protein S17 [Myxococcales bacterium]